MLFIFQYSPLEAFKSKSLEVFAKMNFPISLSSESSKAFPCFKKRSLTVPLLAQASCFSLGHSKFEPCGGNFPFSFASVHAKGNRNTLNNRYFLDVECAPLKKSTNTLLGLLPLRNSSRRNLPPYVRSDKGHEI